MTPPNNTVAGLAEKWRADKVDDAHSTSLWDQGYAYARKECASELEAALASPAPSAGVGVDRYSIIVQSEKPYAQAYFDPNGEWCLFNEVRALQHPAAPSVSPSVAGDAGELLRFADMLDFCSKPGSDGVCRVKPATLERAAALIRRLATAEQPVEWDGATRTMQEHLYVMTGERDRYRMLAEHQAEKVARLEQRIAERPGSAVQGAAVAQIIARIQIAIEHGDRHGWSTARNELLGIVESDYTTPPPALAADPAEQFCDGHCSALEHHPDCVMAAPAAEQPETISQRGRLMKLYKQTAFVPDVSFGEGGMRQEIRWHGSQADAAAQRAAWVKAGTKRNAIETEEVEVPTDKKGLIDFLNGKR